MKNLVSYWEKESFLKYDIIVIGGGLVGLSTACELVERMPKVKVAILERGILPTGASTKNAGFMCFGSPSELLNDVKNCGWEVVMQMVEKKLDGMARLKNRLIFEDIELKEGYNGFEILTKDQLPILDKMDELNRKLSEVPFFARYPSDKDNVFKLVSEEVRKSMKFKNVEELICTTFEMQVNTGKMMKSLYLYAQKLGISIFTGTEVESFEELNQTMHVQTTQNISFECGYLFIANNAFYQKFYPNENKVKSGRGQVLITERMEKGLPFMGNYHFDGGFVYFRNIGRDRLMLGGGRNIDFEGETSSDIEITDIIQNNLEKLLKEMILPERNVKIEQRWAGIMAFTDNHLPIIEKKEKRVFTAVGLNGMGVAIGSNVAKEVVDLFLQK
ncbi:MAG: FAD-binding oxidoreductase [Bacteroidetes bacterium]|nr:MAG: FAD-binding oxidoreductase [Bacteroidota bacterium]TAG91320.1 MAG: FAD-binding oxidoreductase [Bacteroidota bacterium]